MFLARVRRDSISTSAGKLRQPISPILTEGSTIKNRFSIFDLTTYDEPPRCYGKQACPTAKDVEHKYCQVMAQIDSKNAPTQFTPILAQKDSIKLARILRLHSSMQRLGHRAIRYGKLHI